MADIKQKFMDDVVDILTNNIGKYGAALYEKHYENKDMKTIIESLELVLKDVVGPKNTKKQLEILKTKYE